jgi:predicted PurR-regulated permease PerM
VSAQASQNGAADVEWSMPRGVIVLLGGAGAVVLVAGMQALADILGPVLLALMLTVAVRPLMSWAERRGWPRWLAILITLLAINLIVIGLAGALAVSVAQLATLLPTYQAQFAALIDDVTGLLGQVGIGADQVRTALDQVDFSRVASLIGSLLVGLAGAFSIGARVDRFWLDR